MRAPVTATRALRLSRIRSDDAALWEELHRRTPDASFFAGPRYAALAAPALAMPAALFAFQAEDGARLAVGTLARPAGVLRRDLLAPGGGLPGQILCDAPLTPARAEALLAALARIPDAAFHLSFEPRTVPPVGDAPERTARREPFFVLDLAPGYERVFADAFAKDFREQCRKSARRGVSVGFAEGRADFVAFGHLYRRAAQAWNPAARRPLAFFAACAREAAAPASPVHLLLARSERHDGAAVAGLLLVHVGDTVTAWMAAMDRGARELAPSAAVYRAAVEWACARGVTRFLLGASGGIASVEAFKRSLGAEPVPCVTGLEVRGRAREWIRRTRAAVAVARS